MASFVPQLIEIAREKDSGAVSLRMFAITIVGFVLWTIYGLMQNAWPVAGANTVGLILASGIFLLRLKCGDASTSKR